jgi:hypothetical protein
MYGGCIEPAIKHYPSLKSIDSVIIKNAEKKDLALEEQRRTIGYLIDTQEVRDVLISNGILIAD